MLADFARLLFLFLFNLFAFIASGKLAAALRLAGELGDEVAATADVAFAPVAEREANFL